MQRTVHGRNVSVAGGMCPRSVVALTNVDHRSHLGSKMRATRKGGKVRQHGGIFKRIFCNIRLFILRAGCLCCLNIVAQCSNTASSSTDAATTKKTRQKQNNVNRKRSSKKRSPWQVRCASLTSFPVSVDSVFVVAGSVLSESDRQKLVEGISTKIYVCSTMWHETATEMVQVLKSIMR